MSVVDGVNELIKPEQVRLKHSMITLKKDAWPSRGFSALYAHVDECVHDECVRDCERKLKLVLGKYCMSRCWERRARLFVNISAK